MCVHRPRAAASTACAGRASLWQGDGVSCQGGYDDDDDDDDDDEEEEEEDM